MSAINMAHVSWFKKIKDHKSTFGKEITAAVVLKFLLLAGLWWLFFKGHKQSVDSGVIAAKLLGESPTVIQVPNSPERP
jgi:hypothetical protein